MLVNSDLLLFAEYWSMQYTTIFSTGTHKLCFRASKKNNVYYESPVGPFLISNFCLLTYIVEIIKAPGRAISYF